MCCANQHLTTFSPRCARPMRFGNRRAQSKHDKWMQSSNVMHRVKQSKQSRRAQANVQLASHNHVGRKQCIASNVCPHRISDMEIECHEHTGEMKSVNTKKTRQSANGAAKQAQNQRMSRNASETRTPTSKGAIHRAINRETIPQQSKLKRKRTIQRTNHEAMHIECFLIGQAAFQTATFCSYVLLLTKREKSSRQMRARQPRKVIDAAKHSKYKGGCCASQ